jgi:hypothetical protein
MELLKGRLLELRRDVVVPKMHCQQFDRLLGWTIAFSDDEEETSFSLPNARLF